MGFWGQDPQGNVVTILNQMVNFGWEYVWHCHLLGHEENDMMRPLAFGVKPETPTSLTVTNPGGTFRLNLTWNDNSISATGFTIERASDPAFTLDLTTFNVAKAAGIPQAYTDTTPVAGTLYYYRVLADDVIGGISGVPTEPSMTVSSDPSNVVKYPTNRYSITVISPHGTVVKSPNQASYTAANSVSLTATAFPGWTFANWTGNVPGSPNSNNPVGPFAMGAADRTITANYTPVNPTISGNAGVAGATITYTGGSTVANASGNYSFSVTPGWNGTVTPSKTGYVFSPANRPYTNVRANQSAQDYTATLLTYTISGNTGVGGVTLSYTDGTDKLVNSDSGGAYSFAVSYNWTGTVTPAKTGYTFTPASRPYTNVLANWPAQNYTANPILMTITGNAGIAGAVLHYMDGTPKTATADGTGAYTITVVYNWSGTVTPALPGYIFTPANRVYSPVLVNQTAQDYTAALIPNTISGSAGVAGAILSYTDGTPKTATADAFGNYAITVTPGWTGTVTPALTGYTFAPVSITYSVPLSVSLTGQNYAATANTYTISGNAGMPGVTLSYNQVTPQTATADAFGNYSFTISYSTVPLVVTPSLAGFNFVPATMTYTALLANQTAQNYTVVPITYTITGNAGVAGATMTYTGGSTVADGSGIYTITIPYNWSGTVTPTLAGYTFAPVNQTYSNVLANQTAQDYVATPVTFTISGNTGVSGVTLTYTDGSLKTATSDGTGSYSFSVSYNWNGTVTPSLAGYTFSPPSRPYTNVLADQTLQNYAATANFFTITGNAGMPGVTLSYNDGAPKTTTTDAVGNYSFVIPFSALPVTVTPVMTGFTFLPVNRSYFSVVADQPAQDYAPTAITYTITGNAGMAGVTLTYTDGTLKTATSDGTGLYTFKVSYSWTGTVTVSMPGYVFAPFTRSYLNVLSDQLAQDFVPYLAFYQYVPGVLR